jgi:hypothetical protein
MLSFLMHKKSVYFKKKQGGRRTTQKLEYFNNLCDLVDNFLFKNPARFANVGIYFFINILDIFFCCIKIVTLLLLLNVVDNHQYQKRVK